MMGQGGQGRLDRVDKTGLAGQGRWDTTGRIRQAEDRAGMAGQAV
jgi:hypothetical protein